MKQEFDISGQKQIVEMKKSESGYTAEVGDKSYNLKVKRMESGIMLLDVDGKCYKVYIGENGGKYSIAVLSEDYTVEKVMKEDSQTATFEEEKKEGNIVTTPMPGKVIKVLCQEGEHVSAGQTLVIIEAMKMENNINAHKEAVIKKIVAKEGDQVHLSDPIIEFESEESE